MYGSGLIKACARGMQLKVCTAGVHQRCVLEVCSKGVYCRYAIKVYARGVQLKVCTAGV